MDRTKRVDYPSEGLSMGSISEVSAGLDLVKTFGIMKTSETDLLKSVLKLTYVKINALP